MNASYTALDPRALEWLRMRLRLACDVVESLEALRREGYPDPAIIAGFEAVRPRGNALAGGTQAPPLVRRAPPGLRRIDTPKFDAWTLDHFLTADECAALIALSSENLKASAIAGDPADRESRTSRTAYLGDSPVAARIDDKICRTLGIRAEYSEGIQAQRYDVGQQFKPHYDAFQPGSDAWRRMASMRGNRTWTFMVYLDDGMEGGATRFTEIAYAVRPQAGMALFWNNLHPDGSPNLATRHCGEPVTAGHKTIITKWFRVMGDGPVFHDEAAP